MLSILREYNHQKKQKNQLCCDRVATILKEQIYSGSSVTSLTRYCGNGFAAVAEKIDNNIHTYIFRTTKPPKY